MVLQIAHCTRDHEEREMDGMLSAVAAILTTMQGFVLVRHGYAYEAICTTSFLAFSYGI
jgi:hypothetical protein